MSTDQNGWITVDHSSKSKKKAKQATSLDGKSVNYNYSLNLFKPWTQIIFLNRLVFAT